MSQDHMDNAAPGSAHRAIADAVAEAGGCRVAQLGLRFDRVAVRVLDQLRTYADACAPESVAVILTLTAPIRMPKQVVSALQRELSTLVEDGGHTARNIALSGSQARLRLVEGLPKAAPKLLGFVHDPEVDPARIDDLAVAWLRTRA
jgi:hypothetical protein